MHSLSKYSYPSPVKLELDQKEKQISDLKSEINELRQNEKDFHELTSSLKNLEHRFVLLQEEKLRNENDFRNRNEMTMKTIANLKTDVDTLKSAINEKNIEIQELRSENNSLKDQSDQRGYENSQLKSELSIANENLSRINDNIMEMEKELEINKNEKNQLLADNDSLSEVINQLMNKNADYDKQVKDLELKNNRWENENGQLQKKIEGLIIEIQEKNDNIKYFNEQLGASKKDNENLEDAIRTLEAQNEKNRNESMYHQKNYQNESLKSNDLGKKLVECDGIIKELENQLENCKSDFKKYQNDSQKEIYELNKELDNHKKTIEILLIQNKEIIEELERFTSEDEQIRGILNRKARLPEMKSKHMNDFLMNPSSTAIFRESKASPYKK